MPPEGRLGLRDPVEQSVVSAADGLFEVVARARPQPSLSLAAGVTEDVPKLGAPMSLGWSDGGSLDSPSSCSRILEFARLAPISTETWTPTCSRSSSVRTRTVVTQHLWSPPAVWLSTASYYSTRACQSPDLATRPVS
jgi:hypothetical protein